MLLKLNELENFFSRNRKSIDKGLRPALRQSARDYIESDCELQTSGCPPDLIDEFRQVVKNEKVCYSNRDKEMFVVQNGYNYLFGGRDRW